MKATGKQIKAARALLDWSQDDLSKRAGVDKTVISRMESGDSNTSQKSFELVLSALASERITFTDNGGVEFLNDRIIHFDQEDWFNDVLEDMIKSFAEKGGEILFLGGDDSVTPPEAVERFRTLRKQGVYFRNLIKEGDTYAMGDVREYKWLPEAYFSGHIVVIYGYKVILDMGRTGLLIDNKDIANALRNAFNLIWSLLPESDFMSTADVRF